MTPTRILVFLTMFFPASLWSQTGNSFSITLDGIIDQDEWADAKTYSLEKGGQVKVMADSNNIYVAVSSGDFGWSHVYLNHGATIYVLHASAALGASVYVLQDDKTWKATQSFKYELRNKGMTEEDKNARLSYFQKNGWVGTVTWLHANNHEFVISRTLFKGKPIRIAAMRAADAQSPHFWPATLKDQTLQEKLVRGDTPEVLTFDPATWGSIQ